MTKINYIKNSDSQILVGIPYDLKDIFKKSFNSAKWNASHKKWSLEEKFENRLISWIKKLEKQNILEEIEALNERELSESEISELERDLEQVEKEIERKKLQISDVVVINNKLQLLKSVLEESESELDSLTQELHIEECKKIDHMKSIEEIISSVTSAGEIERLRDDLKKYYNRQEKTRFKEKGDFHDVQVTLSSIRDNLSKIGIKCDALNLAIGARFNNKRRDYFDLDKEIIFEILE